MIISLYKAGRLVPGTFSMKGLILLVKGSVVQNPAACDSLVASVGDQTHIRDERVYGFIIM